VALLSLQYREYSTLAHLLLKLIRPDLLLVLSTERMATMTAMGFRASRIPLGVDTEIFRPPEPGEKEALRAKYGVGSDRIMLHVGHLSAGRNLRFFSKLLDEGIKIAVVTSTSTEDEPEIRAVLEHPSVAHIDTFVENIAEVYRLADAYAFPTFSEMDAIEIPLSVLEAMAVNLPVVTTDFGGLPDLFTEGNGLFICSSEDELVRKAKEALRLEQAGTREMVMGLSWKHVAEAIMETVEADLL
jgi:glycosyltransferase involved in cell wall biosynthesis